MPAKKRHRRVAVPDLAGDLLVAPDDLAHPRFDPCEILGRERLGPGEIVIEPGLGRRPEGDLGLGIKLLDRLGHDMGGVVAQDLEPLGRLAGDDRNRGVVVDDGRRDRAAGRRCARRSPPARPGPIAAAISAPLVGPAKRGGRRPAGSRRGVGHWSIMISAIVSAIVPCSVNIAVGRGKYSAKTPSVAGGVCRVRAYALDQRTRPPAPRRGGGGSRGEDPAAHTHLGNIANRPYIIKASPWPAGVMLVNGLGRHGKVTRAP